MPWTYLGCISTSSLAKSQGFSEGIAGATGSMSPLLNRPALWVTESWDILPLQLVIGTCLSCHLPNTQRMQRLQFVRSCWIIAEQMEVFRIDAGNLQILDVMWRCCSTSWVLWLTWASIGLFLFQPSCSWPNPFPKGIHAKKSAQNFETYSTTMAKAFIRKHRTQVYVFVPAHIVHIYNYNRKHQPIVQMVRSVPTINFQC